MYKTKCLLCVYYLLLLCYYKKISFLRLRADMAWLLAIGASHIAITTSVGSWKIARHNACVRCKRCFWYKSEVCKVQHFRWPTMENFTYSLLAKKKKLELCRGLDSAGACSAPAQNGAGAWNFIFVLRKMKKNLASKIKINTKKALKTDNKAKKHQIWLKIEENL